LHPPDYVNTQEPLHSFQSCSSSPSRIPNHSPQDVGCTILAILGPHPKHSHRLLSRKRDKSRPSQAKPLLDRGFHSVPSNGPFDRFRLTCISRKECRAMAASSAIRSSGSFC
jgi:hypothetical protein